MSLPTTYRVRIENERGGRRTVVILAPTPARAQILATPGLHSGERVVSVSRQRA